MGLLDVFRKPPPLRCKGDLEDFIDIRSAFLIQKCVYEYSRARTGILSQKLFKEPAFLEALSRARWEGYPIALQYVTEMVEGVLRRYAPGRETDLFETLIESAVAVTGRYPVPEGFRNDFWERARGELEDTLRPVQVMPPKPVKDIPKGTYQRIVTVIPIHNILMTPDHELIRNHLRSNLCRIHDDFIGRAEFASIVDSMLSDRPQVDLPAVARTERG